MALHIHVHRKTADRKVKDASESENRAKVKEILGRLVNKEITFAKAKSLAEAENGPYQIVARGGDKYVMVYIPTKDTKDADYSAKHVGNFRFEVITPTGEKKTVKANTSEEAIKKVKAGTKDAKRLIDTLTDGNVSVKVYYDNEWSEYQCRLFVAGKDQGDGPAYYTDDKQDALGTAKDMLRREVERQKKK